MINLNDEKARQNLIRRYLNAETTLEEESLLADFLNNTDMLLTAEEKDVLLLQQSSILIGRLDISTDKADEFDRLIQKNHNKRSFIVAIRWIATVAAAVICAVMLLPSLQTDKAVEHPKVAKVIPTETDIMSVREHKDKDTTEIINKKAFITDKAIQEVRKTAQKPTEDPAIFAKANASVHNLKTTEQKDVLLETSNVQDISTSELLETIQVLSSVESNDNIITASSCDEGFIIKISKSNGSSSSYLLRRCYDGTSIELKSQAINL